MAEGTDVYLMSWSFHGIVIWRIVNKCAYMYIWFLSTELMSLFLFSVLFNVCSSQALPEHYRALMTEPESPIIDFYPRGTHSCFGGRSIAGQVVFLGLVLNGCIVDFACKYYQLPYLVLNALDTDKFNGYFLDLKMSL